MCGFAHACVQVSDRRNSNVRERVAMYFNLVVGGSKKSDVYWQIRIPGGIVQRYGRVALTKEEQHDGLLIRAQIFGLHSSKQQRRRRPSSQRPPSVTLQGNNATSNHNHFDQRSSATHEYSEHGEHGENMAPPSVPPSVPLSVPPTPPRSTLPRPPSPSPSPSPSPLPPPPHHVLPSSDEMGPLYTILRLCKECGVVLASRSLLHLKQCFETQSGYFFVTEDILLLEPVSSTMDLSLLSGAKRLDLLALQSTTANNWLGKGWWGSVGLWGVGCLWLLVALLVLLLALFLLFACTRH